MNLALDGAGTVAGEVNGTVAAVAVELGGGAVVLLKAVLKGIVGDVLQAHGLPKVLLQEGVEILAGDLLDDEPRSM